MRSLLLCYDDRAKKIPPRSQQKGKKEKFFVSVFSVVWTTIPNPGWHKNLNPARWAGMRGCLRLAGRGRQSRLSVRQQEALSLCAWSGGSFCRSERSRSGPISVLSWSGLLKAFPAAVKPSWSVIWSLKGIGKPGSKPAWPRVASAQNAGSFHLATLIESGPDCGDVTGWTPADETKPSTVGGRRCRSRNTRRKKRPPKIKKAPLPRPPCPKKSIILVCWGPPLGGFFFGGEKKK